MSVHELLSPSYSPYPKADVYSEPHDTLNFFGTFEKEVFSNSNIKMQILSAVWDVIGPSCPSRGSQAFCRLFVILPTPVQVSQIAQEISVLLHTSLGITVERWTTHEHLEIRL